MGNSVGSNLMTCNGHHCGSATDHPMLDLATHYDVWDDEALGLSPKLQPGRCPSEAPSRASGSAVFLNIYHLNGRWEQSNKISGDLLGLGGAFHAGVEVFGSEWTFGYEGIYCHDPRDHTVHMYHQSIFMGDTACEPEEVADIITEMCKEWLAEDYKLLSRNCCSFAQAFCQEIVGEDIPSWVDRLPLLASKAVAGLENIVDVDRLALDFCADSRSLPPTPMSSRADWECRVVCM
mmetsp:Transcript_799/g.1964  ORF Transcript_799/g.1964 Transcript_799/m.1964 type:complete len:235 (-) Transcript_799:123-827(-)